MKLNKLFLVAAISAASTFAHAATYQWDINGAAAGLGGTGTWNTTNTFWDEVGVGADDGTQATTAYTFTNADTAVFGGTAGTVTLGAATTVNALQFNTTGYTLTGSTLTLDGTTPTITTATGVNATISSIIAGSSGFTKDGAGMLTVTAANTYSGATIINGGTLRLQRGTTFANTSGFTVNTNGTLNIYTAGNTWAVPAKPISLNGGTLSFYADNGTGQYSTGLGLVTVNSASFITVQAGNNGGGNTSSFFLDGGLAGSADLTITSNTSGLGVILRNSNTNYSGKLTVNGNASTTYGTASGLAVGALGSTPTLTNADIVVNGTMELGFGLGGGMGWGSGGAATGTVQVDALSGTGVVIANFAAAGSRTLSVGNNNGGDTFSGTIANGNLGTVSLTKNGSGTQVFSGTNTYTGATTINANGGTLRFAKATSFYNSTGGSVSGVNAAKLTVNSGGSAAFNVGGTGEFTSTDIDTLLGASTASVGFKTGSTLGLDTTNASGSTFTHASGISNTFAGANIIGLTKSGTGTLVLSGTNTYTGATTVNAGTLSVSGSAMVASGSNGVSIASGATLAISGTLKLVSNTSQIANSGTFDLSSGADVLDLNGQITGLTNGSTYNLLSTVGAITGNFDSITGYDTTNFTASFNNTNGVLTFTAVPEPSTYGLIGAGALAAVTFVRRRRKHAGKLAA